MPATSPDDQDTLPSNLKSRIANSYNAIAETYGKWTEQHVSTRLAALDTLLPKLQARSGPLTILELGCGSGLPVIPSILDQFDDAHYIANEISSKQLELARANLRNRSPDLTPRITFIQGDMLEVERAEGFLDAVIAMYSIIHLPREEQTQLMTKMHAWLKPGGGLLLANFAAEELPQAVQKDWLHEPDGWMFWSGWGVEGTLSKLRAAGFEILQHEVKKDVVDASFLWVLAQKS